MTAQSRAAVHDAAVHDAAVHDAVVDAAVDEAVAAGQPGLPGLGLLLDDETLSSVLRHHGWLTGAEQVRVDRLRLKPGTRAQAALRATPSGRWFLAGTYSRDSWGKAGKDRDTARRRGQPVLVLPDLRVVVTAAAADRDLPLLRGLRPDAAAGVTRRVVQALVGGPAGATVAGGGAEAPGPSVRTIAYNPARRWVGALCAPGCGTGDRGTTDGGSTTGGRDTTGGCGTLRPLGLLKAHADRGTPGRALAAAAVLAAAGVATPAAAERLPGLLVTDWVDGRPSNPADDGDAAAVADVLARLAAARDAAASGLGPSGTGLPHLGPVDLLRQAAEAASALTPLDLDAGTRARDVVRRLGAALPALDGTPVPVHGDLSSDQVLVGARGPVVLDLDRAATGPPGWDAAAWLAAQVAAGVPLRDVAGLPGVAVPDPLLAAAALIRAPEPWRRRRTGRTAATAALLDLAEAALEPASLGRAPGGRR